MQTTAIIEVSGVHRTLHTGERELSILRGVSFEVDRGEWVALSGPSGSGKSTLLGVLAGLDRPTRGQVRLEGETINTLPEGRLARLRNEKIGVVFQSFHLIPSMTALENVEAPLYIHPQRRQARAMATYILGEVGLAERLDHFPHQLSGGEQQRVAIARALVAGPRVLFADEPTGNLDSATSCQVLTLLSYLHETMSVTVVMVTHDPMVASYAGRCLHLVDGRLQEPPPVPEARVLLEAMR